MRKSKRAKLISMFLTSCLLMLGVVMGGSTDADAQRRARLRRVGTGAAVGAGLGVFAARRHDIGITNDFEKAVADRLEPGKAAAVALVQAEIAPDIERMAQTRGAWTKRVTVAEAQELSAS